MADVSPDLIIAGPTASGKTSLALRIAEEINGEIIGADAFQVYRGLPLITAQPDPDEQARTRHHLIGEIDPMESFHVSRYRFLAEHHIRTIQSRGKRAILVGGTGFYIRAVLYGLSEGLPGPDLPLRARLEQRPLPELARELVQLDPKAAVCVDLQNPRRVVRALEVCLLTGAPFSSFQKQKTDSAGSLPRGIWMGVAREALHECIEKRTHAMFEKGVVPEVESMNGRLGPTASQAIGVREIQSHLRGELSLSETSRKIIELTRQYARRQETWFRKETALVRIAPQDAVAAAVHMVRGAGFEPATSCV
jgi:tRNA dimethylallyltransferase